MVVQSRSLRVNLDGEKSSFVSFLSLDNVPSHSNLILLEIVTSDRKFIQTSMKNMRVDMRTYGLIQGWKLGGIFHE